MHDPKARCAADAALQSVGWIWVETFSERKFQGKHKFLSAQTLASPSHLPSIQMDGGDCGLRFDFEDYLDAVGAGSGSASSEAPILAVGGPSRGCGLQMDGDEDNLRFDFEDDLDAAGAGTGHSVGYFEALIPAAGGPSHGPGIGSFQMDGDEGSLRFDFEDYLDAVGAGSGSMSASSEAPIPVTKGLSHGHRRVIFQQTVCQHWLRGLCKKAEPCSFLHQFDMDHMPVCHFHHAFRFCCAEDCNLKHEIQVCEMFSVGFCPNGPNCNYMHVRLPGPPPPVQEVLQKFQQTNAYNCGPSSGTYQPRDNNCKQKAKAQVQHGSVLNNQNLAVNATLVAQQPAAQHAQTANPAPHLQQKQNAHVQGFHNGSSIKKLPQLQAHFHKGNQGTRLLKVATRRIWILVQWGVCASQKGLMRLNLTKHLSLWRVSFQYSPSLELTISRMIRTPRSDRLERCSHLDGPCYGFSPGMKLRTITKLAISLASPLYLLTSSFLSYFAM
ncbi:zinc finger CCCH domain-containing protein 45-like isoform X3 [Hordeum vulgare subsp. vulgare]|uniref:zinc finger CCCH domain-containing protein 45-like isoform X3 n=1 Tax=Hordeum vulgare subsp. vulgare TaxID=112509 RepID=UPI001D1A46DF|nr:zinc finger CCCH domain-containing protein 45-like isoform X3 [Hordeum vulgare subsp. vulgare]